MEHVDFYLGIQATLRTTMADAQEEFGFAFDLTGAPPALYKALGELFEEVGLKRLQASLFTGPFKNCVEAFRRLQTAEPDLARWASSFVLVKVEHDLKPAIEQTRVEAQEKRAAGGFLALTVNPPR